MGIKPFGCSSSSYELDGELNVSNSNNLENNACESKNKVEHSKNNEEKTTLSNEQSDASCSEKVGLKYIDSVESDELDSHEKNYASTTINSENPDLKSNFTDFSQHAAANKNPDGSLNDGDGVHLNHSSYLTKTDNNCRDILLEQSSSSENRDRSLFDTSFFEKKNELDSESDSKINSHVIEGNDDSSDDVNTNDLLYNEIAEDKEIDTIEEKSVIDLGMSQISFVKNYLFNIFYRFCAFFQRIFLRFHNQENISTNNINEDMNN